MSENISRSLEVEEEVKEKGRYAVGRQILTISVLAGDRLLALLLRRCPSCNIVAHFCRCGLSRMCFSLGRLSLISDVHHGWTTVGREDQAS